MRNKFKVLLDPDPAAGGGGAAAVETNDLPPNSLEAWMRDLPSINNQPGNTNGATAQGSDASPAAVQATPAAKPAAAPDPVPGTKPVPKADTDAASAIKQAEAAKAAEAAKVAKPGEDGEKENWPRTAKEWKEFKTARKEKEEKLQSDIQAREVKIKELETQLESRATDGEPSSESKAEVERLTKTLDELTNRIRVLDVTKHPLFEGYFKGQVDEQLSVAKEILGEERGKKFEELATMPNHPATNEWRKQQMEDMLADLTTLEQIGLTNVQNELVKIERNRQKEITKNQEHVATIQAKNVDQFKAGQAAREKQFHEVAANLGDDKVGAAVFQKRAGDEAWNAGVDQRMDAAKRILFGGKDVKYQDVAKASLHAAAYPFILEAYASDRKEWEEKVATLSAQVKELTAAQPGNRGTTGGTATGQAQARRGAEVGMTPQEAMETWHRNMTAET